MTIYDERNVPILFRGEGQSIGFSPEMHEKVKAAHEAAQRAIDEAYQLKARGQAAWERDEDDNPIDPVGAAHAQHLLHGESIVIHNKAPILGPDSDGEDAPNFTHVGIGASDLQEAISEAIGAFDRDHVGDPNASSDHIYTPNWVSSTHEGLAEALADYYSCDVRELSEVL